MPELPGSSTTRRVSESDTLKYQLLRKSSEYATVEDLAINPRKSTSESDYEDLDAIRKALEEPIAVEYDSTIEELEILSISQNN